MWACGLFEVLIAVIEKGHKACTRIENEIDKHLVSIDADSWDHNLPEPTMEIVSII
jgi:hypothetical protein